MPAETQSLKHGVVANARGGMTPGSKWGLPVTAPSGRSISGLALGPLSPFPASLLPALCDHSSFLLQAALCGASVLLALLLLLQFADPFQESTLGVPSALRGSFVVWGQGPDAGPDPARPSRCGAECTDHGTCNEETAECACLRGYTGADCSTRALPSCHLSPSSFSPCDSALPTSCACLEECHVYLLPHQWLCWNGNFTDAAKLQQSPKVKYDRGPDAAILPRPAGAESLSPAPADACAGVCAANAACPTNGLLCQCTWYDSNAPCTPRQLQCYNNCSAKGNCIGGVCHCNPGFFGMDCSLYLSPRTGKAQVLARPPYAWAQAVWPYSAREAKALRPKVYVYELPAHLTVWVDTFSVDRPEAVWFLERLLNSPFRTANPEEADFFYIPINHRARKILDDGYVIAAVHYVIRTWPYWNLTGGRDHLVLTVGDWGNCEFGDWGRMHSVFLNLTTLTLWGMSRSMHLDATLPCFRPGRDIVAPPCIDLRVYSASPRLGFQQPNRTILLYFQGYSGDTWGTFGHYKWSHGIRQEMFRLYEGRYGETGILMEKKALNGQSDFIQKMTQSTFCLAPCGWGWGMRSTQSVILGCIPVVIQPDILQPLDGDGLNWEEFAVVLKREDMPNIESILRGLIPEGVEQKRRAMDKVWKSFVWSSYSLNPLQSVTEEVQTSLAPQLLQGDAFEGIMEALKRRGKRW